MRQFLTFAVIGSCAFWVDIGVLYTALALTDLGYYAGRVLSFLVAASFSWAANRLFTFRGAEKSEPHRQWIRFVGVNAVGGLVNYAIYALLIYNFAFFREWPVLAVAAGAIVAMFFNFSLSKRYAFRA